MMDFHTILTPLLVNKKYDEYKRKYSNNYDFNKFLRQFKKELNKINSIKYQDIEYCVYKNIEYYYDAGVDDIEGQIRYMYYNLDRKQILYYVNSLYYI